MSVSDPGPNLDPDDEASGLLAKAGLLAKEGVGDNSPPFSVSELSGALKRTVEEAFGHVRVRGEISGWKRHGSGHCYFTLKDEGANIDAVLWRGQAARLQFAPEDGAEVIASGKLTTYPGRSKYQLVVERLELAGEGALMALLDKRRRMLAAEGLFAEERKRALPFLPRTIGIVTSPTGAALQDILNILTRRAPWVQPVLFPVRVQGKGVEREISEAITKLNNPEKFGFPVCDLLIVGRGGGSIEDLWCFNEEAVARAIAASNIPVISAVGHEIDFTIADFVADLRAPTPSAAAELAVPDEAELRAVLENASKRITRSLQTALREPTQQLDSLRSALAQAASDSLRARSQSLRETRLRHLSLHPLRLLERRFDMLVSLRKNLAQLTTHRISREAEKLSRLKTLIRTLGPESAFKRGFSITLSHDGKILRSAKQAESGATLSTKFIDGEVISTVQ